MSPVPLAYETLVSETVGDTQQLNKNNVEIFMYDTSLREYYLLPCSPLSLTFLRLV